MGHPARGAESASASRGVGGHRLLSLLSPTALACLERARSSQVLLKTKTRITVSLPGQIERLMRNERGRGNGIGVPIAPSLTSQPLAVCLNGKIILADSQLT